MPEAEQNLVWNLFSSDPQRIATAFQRLGPRPESWSSLLNELLGFYGLEGMSMPYTMEDFKRDAAERLLSELTPEQRMQGLPLADVEMYLKKHRAKTYTMADYERDAAERFLNKLTPEERLRGLRPEELLRHLPSEHLLAMLPLAEIENYVKQHKLAEDKETPEQPKSPS